MDVITLLLAQETASSVTELLSERDLHNIVYSLIYTGLGVLVFALAFFIMAKVVPFSVRKEIEEDQNTALGIIMGSVVIGLAIIISAAIQG